MALLAGGLATALVAAGCRGDSHPATRAAMRLSADDAASSEPEVKCAHASCGNHFFVDTVPPAACSAGANCTLAVVLVATGDYHINDEYPYKFRADERPGVQFVGKGEGGATVFSKAEKDWTTTDEKSGTMAVTFKPTAAGGQVISGAFKLSVCSAQNCQLEQQPVRVTVTVL